MKDQVSEPQAHRSEKLTDQPGARGMLEQVGTFFRILRQSSRTLERSYQLDITEEEYRKAHEAYNALLFRLASQSASAPETPDFETAAMALGFARLSNGRWFMPQSNSYVDCPGTWDDAKSIFDWWSKASGNASAPERTGNVLIAKMAFAMQTALNALKHTGRNKQALDAAESSLEIALGWEAEYANEQLLATPASSEESNQ